MASEIAVGKNITKWQISISHADSCSVAFAIAESI
jgi:phosphopantetheinyl transferase (holo-ACP synthase)